MARVICPFCLKPHDFMSSLVCPTYQEPVPAAYVRDYDKVPPLWLVTIGFTQHGKTTYLAALMLMLESIGNVWGGVYYRHLDQYTVDTIQQWRREAMFGELPPAGSKAVPRPILSNIYHIPESGSRCLVMYDVAGEIYNSLSEVQEYVTSIKQVNTTWFLVSLPDLLSDQEGKTITDLFNVYLSGMENLRLDLSGRNLIVIYTKGDVAVFPREFKDYLRTDPFQGLTRKDANIPDSQDFSLQDYIQEMKCISSQLEEYTRKQVKGGAPFINMVKASGMNLVFCVTSALGESPDSTSNRLRVDAFRHRVLDPFLWAITLERPTSPRLIGLVVDASQESHLVYDEALLPVVWERLSDYGELTTYYLGQTSPASQPGQRPPKSPPSLVHQRLIGPILEQASPDTRFMVLATGSITDLADFYNSPWRDRVLLVMVEEDHQQDWPNTIVFHPGDAPMVLVDALLRL